jgi:hypothetical protein
VHRLHGVAIGLELLVLIRHLVAPVHEQEFGAEQAHADGAGGQRRAGILRHLDIGQQLDLEPVQRHRRHMAQPLQALLLERALALAVPILFKHDGRRIDDHQAGIAVDDDPVVLSDQFARVLDAHRGGDVEAARDDSRVRCTAAQVRHETVEHGVLELQHVGRADVVGHHDHARRGLAIRRERRPGAGASTGAPASTFRIRSTTCSMSALRSRRYSSSISSN